jgi:fucose 4-O-acetylase-like acetyltransferase
VHVCGVVVVLIDVCVRVRAQCVFNRSHFACFLRLVVLVRLLGCRLNVWVVSRFEFTCVLLFVCLCSCACMCAFGILSIGISALICGLFCWWGCLCIGWLFGFFLGSCLGVVLLGV